MAKRHPVRNSQFMKAIRDVHAFFQEESFKIRNNQPVSSYVVFYEDRITGIVASGRGKIIVILELLIKL
jgi:hypothetical protein